MSLVCYNDFIEEIEAIQEFLNINPDIKEICVNLFKESHKDGITKLNEYLDKTDLYCPMLYKKQILYNFSKGLK